MLPIEIVSPKDPFLLRARESYNIWKFQTEKRMGILDIEHGLKTWMRVNDEPKLLICSQQICDNVKTNLGQRQSVHVIYCRSKDGSRC